MASNNISIRAGFETERALASTSFNSGYQVIGPVLAENPVVIIFDNQTDVDVPISVDAANTWKTFVPGEAIVLDLRANHGIASNFTCDLGVQFYTNAAVGTSGSFRISTIYARTT